MEWLSKYWWILVLVFLLGVFINVIKDLMRVDHKKFLANKPDLPPHRDCNDKWDDDDNWPDKKANKAISPCSGKG
ncbi:YpfN family protein [Mangrovibacter sp. SLW1]